MATQSNLEQREVLLRRVLDALSEESLPNRRPRIRSVGPRAEVRSFLIRSTQNVIDHYRHVLSVHQTSNIEKNAMLRLEEQERELGDLMRHNEEPSDGPAWTS
jgi:hypothetical protein